jgi:hypothetical protein
MSMRKIIGAVFVSLDGVMQAPGAPDEDRTGGFELGGWLAPFWDEQDGEQLDSSSPVLSTSSSVGVPTTSSRLTGPMSPARRRRWESGSTAPRNMW